MTDAPLLTPETYAVLVRVPEVWWREDETVMEIAERIHQTRGSVRRRLNALLALNLIEKRRRQTIDPYVEVRRIAKGD